MPDYLQALDAIVQRIAHARSVPTHSRKPLRVRGGGSKDFFGARLDGDLLETRSLQGIVSYEPTELVVTCLLYTSPSPRDRTRSRMPSSA